MDGLNGWIERMDSMIRLSGVSDGMDRLYALNGWVERMDRVDGWSARIDWKDGWRGWVGIEWMGCMHGLLGRIERID